MTAARRRLHLMCAHSWVPFVVLTGIGFWGLAGFIPPPDPSAEAVEIFDRFRENATGIRVGMAICIFAAAFLLPWGAAISAQIHRLEGRDPLLLWAFVAATGCIVLEFAFPSAFWVAAAYRLDVPQTVRALNDMAWLPWMIVCTGMFQMLILAAVTLADERADPVYPRWFGYYNLWSAFGVAPAGLLYVFQTGPFAWNGIFGFYIPAVTAFSWIVLSGVMTARAVQRQPGQPEHPDDRIEERLRALELRLANRSGALGDQGDRAEMVPVAVEDAVERGEPGQHLRVR